MLDGGVSNVFLGKRQQREDLKKMRKILSNKKFIRPPVKKVKMNRTARSSYRALVATRGEAKRQVLVDGLGDGEGGRGVHGEGHHAPPQVGHHVHHLACGGPRIALGIKMKKKKKKK